MTNHIQMSGNEIGWSMWIKISKLFCPDILN